METSVTNDVNPAVVKHPGLSRRKSEIALQLCSPPVSSLTSQLAGASAKPLVPFFQHGSHVCGWMYGEEIAWRSSISQADQPVQNCNWDTAGCRLRAVRVPVAALSMQSVTPNISTDNKRGFPSTDNNMSSLSSCNHVRGDILVDFLNVILMRL